MRRREERSGEMDRRAGETERDGGKGGEGEKRKEKKNG